MTVSTLHRVILPKCYTQNHVFCETIKLLRKYYVITIIIYYTDSISSVFYLLCYSNTKQHSKYYTIHIIIKTNTDYLGTPQHLLHP